MKWESIEEKREQEEETVSRMISIYCHAKHHTKKGLCPECLQLEEYARSRSRQCPFMESKTFCSCCKVHCYRPDMKEQIRQVMRFSGWRMMFVDPVQALRHVHETWKQKRRQEYER